MNKHSILGREELVSLREFPAALSVYNTTPENPSMTKIAYTAYRTEPSGAGDNRPCAIYLRDREGQPDSSVLLTGFENRTDYHYGINIVWIDDGHIAFMDGYSNIRIIGTPPAQKAPMEEFKGKLGHNVSDGEIIFSLSPKLIGGQSGRSGIHGVGYGPGVYRFNRAAGKVTQILSADRLYDFLERELGGGAGTGHGLDFSHIMFNPSGTKAAMRVDLDIEAENRQCLVTFGAVVPDTDLILFRNQSGSFKKPLHQLWFDDDVIIGVDVGNVGRNKQIMTWRRDGTPIDALTAPVGTNCHISFSQICAGGKRYIASESTYKSDPIVFKIYEYGQGQPPLETVFSLNGPPYTDTTWKKRGHIDSCFSADGAYLYYNKPDDDGRLRVYRRALRMD